MIGKFKQSVFVKTTASTKLTVICLLILVVLVIWGTVYQASNGLYQAKQKFFNSWYLFLFGFIPFPGTVLVMWVLFLNLISSIFFRIGFQWARLGNLLIHIGLIVLLIGGFFTFYYAEESVLSLREGQGSNLSQAYHNWEIAVWQGTDQNRDVYAVDSDQLNEGDVVVFEGLGLEIGILSYFKNSLISFDQNDSGQPDVINSSGIKSVGPKKTEIEPSMNIPGIVFKIANHEKKGDILLYGRDPRPSWVKINQKNTFFSIRKKRFLLPFFLELVDFRKILYPGSDIVKSYESQVFIKTSDFSRKVLISMNKPLRYKNYTVFQSSYLTSRDGVESSNFAVVKNSGRLFPYISSLIIFMGLLIHFLTMLFRKTKKERFIMTVIRKVILGMSVLILWSLFMPANDKKDITGIISTENFRKIVILENGRKKPLDTFAQNLLKQFSGKSRFQKKPAIFWLTRVLFNPRQTHNDKIFLINNPEVLDSFGMEAAGVRERYSFSQFNPFLPEIRKLAMSASRIKREERSKIQSEIIFLYNKLYIYQQLMVSFSFARPNKDFTIIDPDIRRLLKLPEDQQVFSLLGLLDKWRIIQDFKNKIQDRGKASLISAEKDFLKLVNRLESWIDLFYDLPLTIIPHVENGEEKWLSAVDSISRSLKSNRSIKKENHLIADFIKAFLDGDQEIFDKSVLDFNELVLEQFKGQLKKQHISLEVFYNKIDPFYKSQFFYGFTLVFLLLSLLMFKKWFYRIGFFLMALGLSSHTLGIILRMIIMQRPPVTNLYETFVFTGWMAVLLGLLLELFKKKNIGLLTGGISGLVFLLIAGKYALEGDTMGMLVAVLDSNLWLAVHVITITIGFAGVVISGVIGHVYIFQQIFIPGKKEILKNTFQAIYATQAFGLIFTFAGTILGGIWADQSWGRFWGWDPKENGALLVILWSVILFHAKLAKMIGKVGFSLGSIIGIVTVALTWFGVNLLGVGLHSYGFTSGIALSLLIFVSIEFLFVLITGFYVNKIKSP